MAITPDETHKFPHADASLWLGVTLNVAPGEKVLADHMIVSHHRATEDDVLIFARDGNRKVLRVKQLMKLEGGSLAIPVSMSWGNHAEPVEPAEEKRFLAIYDQFDGRTYK